MDRTPIRVERLRREVRSRALAALLAAQCLSGCQLLFPVNEFDIGEVGAVVPEGGGPLDVSLEQGSDAGTGHETMPIEAAEADPGAEAGLNVVCSRVPEEWTLSGLSVWDSDGRLWLTPVKADAGDITQAAGWCNRPLDLALDFMLEFGLSFGVGAEDKGGHGIWCTLIPADFGSFPSYWAGLKPSAAVEFDTACDYYGGKNAEPCCPPNPTADNCWPVQNDHVGFMMNGSFVHGPGMPFANVGNLEDGYLHRVQLVWSASEKKLAVRLQSLSGQWSPVWSYNGDLAAIVGTSRVYYGFIGITASEDHNEWDFKKLSVVP